MEGTALTNLKRRVHRLAAQLGLKGREERENVGDKGVEAQERGEDGVHVARVADILETAVAGVAEGVAEDGIGTRIEGRGGGE